MENLDFLKTEENEARNKFLEKFSPEKIEKLSGLELLKILAFPKNQNSDNLREQFKELYEENYDSLKNQLENKMNLFGSGHPGYDTNFILAFRKNSWHYLQKEISLTEAINIAENIRIELVTASKFLKNNDFNSFYDFLNNSKINLFNRVYIHKYYHILYPKTISCFHAPSWQNFYKEKLGLKGKTYYEIEKFFVEEDPNYNIYEKCKELMATYDIPKSNYLDSIIKALIRLGGKAHLSEIYNMVLSIRNEEKQKINDSHDATIRGVIETHSKNSQKFTGKEQDDIFKKEGEGVWALREGIFENEDFMKDNINENINESSNNDKVYNQPLNQILYGPPGTGKTYNTVIKAMEIMGIINSDDYDNIDDTKYKELKNRFDELKKSGQIEFITFHQSYSYEEFIEGIKPNLNNSTIKYKLEDGILKKIVRKAKEFCFKDFDKTFKIFKKEHPDWTELKTNSEKSPFYIKYNDKSIEIYKNKEESLITTIPYNNLEKYFNLDCQYKFKKQSDLQSGTGLSYLFAIIIELRKYRKPYILIIDEINRGNISKIFGEMITLIEEDKRIGNEHELELTLPYSNDHFGIPNNLYIIGTMNTSDRSIASVDIALRRRFKFIEMMPKSDLVADITIEENKKFQDIFEALNEKITILLDRDHQIGHSYFIKDKFKSSNGEELNNESKIELLKNIWFDEILPLLNEYFYNDWDKLQALLGEAEDKKEKNSSFIAKRDLSKYDMKDIDKEDKYVFDFVDRNEVNFEKALLNIVKEINKQKVSDENETDNK